MNDVYCAMIHGGLDLRVEVNNFQVQSCCLRHDNQHVHDADQIWYKLNDSQLRQQNIAGKWNAGCFNCQRLENVDMISMRQGMNQGLGLSGATNLAGPARIDLHFDMSCNLACRTCGPNSSTFWQKHLKKNKLWSGPLAGPRDGQHAITALSALDLSNLRQLVFCGGETLLGQEYWKVARWLVDNVPDAQTNLTLCFQTNGTQGINARHFDIIEKTHLVKLHISIDGIKHRFEYLRWPASWNQVVDNIMTIRDCVPSNVMFVVEETVSIFNLYYLDETENWARDNFYSNREGDVVNHTRHLANGMYAVQSCSQEYVQALAKSKYIEFIPRSWHENPTRIQSMMQQIKTFDEIRQQNFVETFPELAIFFSRFLR